MTVADNSDKNDSTVINIPVETNNVLVVIPDKSTNTNDWRASTDVKNFKCLFEAPKGISILAFGSLEALLSFCEEILTNNANLLLYYYESLEANTLDLSDLILPDHLAISWDWNFTDIESFTQSLKWTSEAETTLKFDMTTDNSQNLPKSLFSYTHLTVHRFDSGIIPPSEIESHCFEDKFAIAVLGVSPVLLSLSKGFQANVFIPSNCIISMSGELRYQYKYGLSPLKKNDSPSSVACILKKTLEKGSICNCPYPDDCDSRRSATIELDQEMASKLESMHVHSVYENIADHFSDTRSKPWPKVMDFLNSVNPTGLLIDVGCGNGKYFGHHPGMIQIGCDHSIGLLQIVKNRAFEGVRCDALHLPFRSNLADALISIAVIHHLSTWERRYSALNEMIRVLKPGGRLLVYAWAKEQSKDSTSSSYLKQASRSAERSKQETTVVCDTQFPLILPVHKNRTNFQHTDILVPWKKKSKNNDPAHEQSEEKTFHRYYHMFQEGELEKLAESLQNCSVEDVYYHQGNWCMILRKNVI